MLVFNFQIGENIYYLDFSTVAAKRFRAQFPSYPSNQILADDYFKLSDFNGFFDVIIEQTFFCAISPNKRVQYINKTHELLKKNGSIIGLLFNVNFNGNPPPYGGTKEDYELLFKTKFNILKIETCYNSVSPRANNELWISMQKP